MEREVLVLVLEPWCDRGRGRLSLKHQASSIHEIFSNPFGMFYQVVNHVIPETGNRPIASETTTYSICPAKNGDEMTRQSHVSRSYGYVRARR